MKGRRMAPDLPLFLLTLGLLVFGLVMLYSASAIVADASDRSPSYFLGRQSVWAALGCLAMIAVARSDYRLLNRPAVVWAVYGAVIVSLFAALLSPSINGVHRWVQVAGFSLQPSEPARLGLVVALAHLLAIRRADSFRTLLLPLACTGFLASLIYLQPDLGTATLLVVVGAAVIFLGGARLKHLALLTAVCVPLFVAGVLAADYRVARILTFLDPFADPLGDGFQLSQSLIALGSGGVTGVGFAASRQKLLYLPEPHSDFVFSVVGEELGFIGAGLVVVFFLLFTIRGLVVSCRAPDRFGMLLGAGATLTIALQAFLHFSVATAILPTTGLPLPFVSAGGSALVTTLLAAGLVLSVSQRVP